MIKCISKSSRRGSRMAALAATGLLLAGCAAGPVSTATVVQNSAAAVASNTLSWAVGYADYPAIAQPLVRLLAEQVDADKAVQVALLANPALHRIYFDLRLSPEAVANAVLADSKPGTGIEFQFVETAIGSVRRSGTEVERLKFEQTKLAMAGEVLRVALGVRRSQAEAVAARQIADLAAELKVAAEASAELGRRMARVGNWPRLNEYREAAMLGEVSVQVAKMRQAEMVARERLSRELGVWGVDVGYKLPAALPALPTRLDSPPDIEEQAVRARLDIRALMFEIAADVRDFELDGYDEGALLAGTRFVEVASAQALGGSEPRGTVRVPVFGFASQASLSKAARFMALLTQTSQATIAARADAREAAALRQTAFDIARHYADHMVPLHARLAEESVLRYNGMLASVFDLLSGVRERMAVDIASVEAQRDFWIAAADLENAIRAGSYSAGASKVKAE